MALPTRERGAQWSRGPIWLGFVCDPPGCVYDLKGALCTMALPRLEAGSDPGMIISALAIANRRRALHSRHSHASPWPCPSHDLVRFVLADSVSVCPASQIVRFDMARKKRSAAQIAAAERGSETGRNKHDHADRRRYTLNSHVPYIASHAS